MSDVDIGEIIFLVLVFSGGLGGFIWALRQEED